MKQDYWTYNKPLSMTGFGGGATSLQNAGGGSRFTFDDAAYSGFFTSGAAPLNFDNSSADRIGGNTGNYFVNAATHGGLSPFYDHSQSKIFVGFVNPNGSYEKLQYFSWSQGGNNYSGNAGFYGVSTTNATVLNSNPAGDFGRGLTVAYLQDGHPVIVRTTTNSNLRFHFYDYPTSSNSYQSNYLGYLNINQVSSTGQNDPYTDTTGESEIVFTGTHILLLSYGSSNAGYIWGYDLPANTSAINSSSTISATAKWTKSVTAGHAFYGAAFTGDGIIYNYYGNNSVSAVYDRLSGNGQVSGFNGTHTFVRNYNYSPSTTNNFGLGIDYRNRKLILGGYYNNEYHVFGE